MSGYYDAGEFRPNSMEKQWDIFRTPTQISKLTHKAWPKSTELGGYLRSYVNMYPDVDPPGLYLHSKSGGSGKSSFAVTLTRMLIAREKTRWGAYYHHSRDLFNYLRQLNNEMGTWKTTTFFTNLLRADMIIVDDLGVTKFTRFASEVLYDLMEVFWQEGKHVIVTSKFSIEELSARAEDDVESEILDSILSRMTSLFSEIPFPEEDHR